MNIVNCKPLLLLLWRSRGLRTFHFRNYRCRYLTMNNYNNISATTADHYGWNSTSNINRHHGPVPPVYLLPTYKAHAHSQQHFSTTTTTSNESSDKNTTRNLPDSIEHQCDQWAQILRAEWEAGNAKHNWTGRKLSCTKVHPGLKTSIITLSTDENLAPEQLLILHQFFQLGQNVEIKRLLSHQPQPQQSNSIDPLGNNTTNLSGTVRKHFSSGILIAVNQYFDLQQRQWLKQCHFDIRKIESPYKLDNQLAFLAKRRSDWHKWPGYATLLQAFKCQPLPEDTGLDDSVDWVSSDGKKLDPSQCAALCAALNMKRPIVAVHGPPGSGKTHLLAKYLHILSQQGKKVLVISSTNAGLYHLMGTFWKKYSSAASSNGTFLCLRHFDAKLASIVIGNESLERLLEKKSFGKLTKDKQDEETQKHYKLTSTLKSAMERRPDLREDDLMREAEEVSGQMREISRQMKDEATKTLLQGTSILFTNVSHAMLNLFARIGLNSFDVVIIDDAAKLPEFDSWLMAMSTAPVLRLFGDYIQPGIPLRSSIGRESNFRRSLLQRLDEEFGPELNFHLRRQYRSNAAIQAWPNRAFYGQRAAEPDESVRAIRLDDLLEEGKSPPPELITDPLVLVDLGQLEGEWRDWMLKAEKGGNSWFNWGEAFLTASHLRHLFEHLPQLCPFKICYSTLYDAQRNLIRIFSDLFVRYLQKLAQIRMEDNKYVQGQQFDVVLRDSVTVPLKLLTDPYHLKHLSIEMCRARRQFIWFANSKWLEEGSEQSRQLLQTFREYGRIIGPNQLLPPAESSDFWKMPPMEMEEEEENCHQQEKKLMNKRKRKGIRTFL